jgi:tetratricopeptide (TPR) repeat protein
MAVRYLNLIECYIALGRLDAARAIDERLRTEAPAHFFAEHTKFLIALHAGDAAGAHEAADRLARHDNAPLVIRARAVAIGAFADIAAGKLREARSHVDDAVRFAVAQRVPGGGIEWRLGEAETVAEFLADTAGARRILQNDVAARFDSIAPQRRPYVYFTSVLARAGLVERARAVLARWDAELPQAERGPLFDRNRRQAEAEIDAATGNVQEAIRAFEELRAEWRCQRCFRNQIAELQARAGNVAEAIALYEKLMQEPSDLLSFPVDRVIALQRLGPLYEQAGEPGKAAAAYARFAEMWKDADPELQPRVRAALERARRLTAEPGTTD